MNKVLLDIQKYTLWFYRTNFGWFWTLIEPKSLKLVKITNFN